MVNSINNPLVIAATPLLNAIAQIKHLGSLDDQTRLRECLIDETHRFEAACQQAEISHEVIIAARYCLCTALDEAASLSPSVSDAFWSSNGLLVTFHNETWGGEKFFQLLARLSQQPHEYITLLELINNCLLLGFEGRYRVLDNGQVQLETLKRRMWQIISEVRGSSPLPFSPAPEQLPVMPNRWRSIMPLWSLAALISFIICLIYIVLNWHLNENTQQVLTNIYHTSIPQTHVKENATPLSVMANVNLRAFLRPEIDGGLIAVIDEAGRSTVTLKGDDLFAPGSAAVRARYEQIIKRIAQSMDKIDGKILLVGHSDDEPIRRAAFASNDELSLARARSVQSVLQKYLADPQRVTAEGNGERNPIVPNDTPKNRALNRRVDITLLVSPETPPVDRNVLP